MTDTTSATSAPPIARKEITLRVVVLGLLLAVVMGPRNVYVGLRAGMTVSASIPAAVMAMLLFKMLFKDSSILEANQVQTCASAGESLAAGIIFTMPAMILIGFWDSFDFWSVTIIALTGGLLGILFMIPMRKVFILNNPELAYPEGVACAAVLRAGDSDSEDAEQTGAAKNLVFGQHVRCWCGLGREAIRRVHRHIRDGHCSQFAHILFRWRPFPYAHCHRIHREIECRYSYFYRRCHLLDCCYSLAGHGRSIPVCDRWRL